MEDIPAFIQEWINDFVANAHEGHVKEVKTFVEKFPQLVDFHDEHYTCGALAAAASTGQADIVTYLLGAGASPHDCDANGWKPLHHAVYRGSFPAVKKLLEAGADAAAWTMDDVPRTPLMIAAQKGHGTVAALLLLHDAKPDARDRKGFRALDLSTSADVSAAIEVWYERNGISMQRTVDRLKSMTLRNNPFKKKGP